MVNAVNNANPPGVRNTGLIMIDQIYITTKTKFAKIKNHNSGCSFNVARREEYAFFIVFSLYRRSADMLLYLRTVSEETISKKPKDQ